MDQDQTERMTPFDELVTSPSDHEASHPLHPIFRTPDARLIYQVY